MVSCESRVKQRLVNGRSVNSNGWFSADRRCGWFSTVGAVCFFWEGERDWDVEADMHGFFWWLERAKGTAGRFQLFAASIL